MGKFIIPRSAPERKAYQAIPTNLHSTIGDFTCPQPACRSGCYFSSAAQRVWCPQCGWVYNLTAEQATELAEAVAGITDLPIAQYLLILASDGTATRALTDEQLWIAEGGQA